MKTKILFVAFLLSFACKEKQIEIKQITTQDITYEVVELPNNDLWQRLGKDGTLYHAYKSKLLNFEYYVDFKIDKICYFKITNNTNSIVGNIHGTKDSLLYPSSFDRSSVTSHK